MQEIKCPKCGEVFQIDEAGYAEIVKQVRTREFNDELQRQKSAMDNEKKMAVDLAVTKANSAKDDEIAKLKNQLAAQSNELNNMKDKSAAELKIALSQKEQEITQLRSAIEANKSKTELEIKTALQDKDSQIKDLQSKLQIEKSEAQLRETNLKQQYDVQLKAKDETIAFYKDFKAKESTKQIGEDLEQFCLAEFNKNRAIGFQNAYFEKDNEVSSSSGSKGDFIFRDFSGDDEDKIEFISIMFEMKNQADTTATKKKNEDFFKELDKDRNEKKCEYAVLVSMLEEDNDYYNTGIVDVSYKYPKMYVIRPQFFIQIITILRNAALNSLEYKREIAQIRNQNIDITNFESDLNLFKDKFLNNVDLAMRQHSSAIDEIDKAIKTLQKIKDLFEKSDNNLRLANNKLEDLTIKKLTRNNPTMKKKFDELQ
ncbi:hypothetical protein SAMN04487775_101102 [Treponema bryantii]|uniref:DUF2130 domain-containing protein n=1 Tax=Treponema bryantii TaxID=163 RepID=A0A1I3HV18_9SPIR|nr:DUF2130 domain-containing protein [Treponema bryantii]SFI39596.1 hypothetical protein SAMN04487775_101102 [Treponema bryantii]